MKNCGLEFETAAGAGNQLSLFALARFPRSARQRAGVTLLLVILILAAILSISIGIFDVTFGEIRISGEVGDSFLALYAADQGIEKTLYDDRVANTLCSGSGSCAYGPVRLTAFPNGSCATVRLSRTGGGDTTVTATGEYRCSSPVAAVKQALLTTYRKTSGGGGPLPISQWKMDESSGSAVNDSAGPTFENGTAVGTTIVTGVSGAASDKARSFNGTSDYVSIPDSTALGLTNAATLNAWIKRSSSGTNDTIISKYNNSPGVGHVSFFFYTNPNSPFCSFQTDTANMIRKTSTVAITDTNWHMVTCTLTSGVMRIYIDGVESTTSDGSAGSFASVQVNSTPVGIGRLTDGGGNSAPYMFGGTMDEVAVYRTALTATQVCDNYKAASGRPSCP